MAAINSRLPTKAVTSVPTGTPDPGAENTLIPPNVSATVNAQEAVQKLLPLLYQAPGDEAAWTRFIAALTHASRCDFTR